MSETRHPLIFVGGHPSVGKTELAKTTAGYFHNLQVVEFRHLLQNAAEERGWKAALLTSKQQEELMEAIRAKIEALRSKTGIVLLGHFVHPLKVEPRRKSDHVDTSTSEYASYVRGLDVDAYVLLEAHPAQLILRAQRRKEKMGIGEAFLKERPQERLEMVKRRAAAEALEARYLAKETGRPLYPIHIEIQTASEVTQNQNHVLRILLKHGGKPFPLFEEYIMNRLRMRKI